MVYFLKSYVICEFIYNTEKQQTCYSLSHENVIPCSRSRSDMFPNNKIQLNHRVQILIISINWEQLSKKMLKNNKHAR